jgi:hypothetical protein
MTVIGTGPGSGYPGQPQPAAKTLTQSAFLATRSVAAKKSQAITRYNTQAVRNGIARGRVPVVLVDLHTVKGYRP